MISLLVLDSHACDQVPQKQTLSERFAASNTQKERFGFNFHAIWIILRVGRKFLPPNYFGSDASPNMCLQHFKVNAFSGKSSPYVSARAARKSSKCCFIRATCGSCLSSFLRRSYTLPWKAAGRLPQVNKSNSKRFEFSWKCIAYYFWLGSELGSGTFPVPACGAKWKQFEHCISQ